LQVVQDMPPILAPFIGVVVEVVQLVLVRLLAVLVVQVVVVKE
jgi:hypothetical protein